MPTRKIGIVAFAVIVFSAVWIASRCVAVWYSLA
jgi:hypothetical protein